MSFIWASRLLFVLSTFFVTALFSITSIEIEKDHFPLILEKSAQSNQPEDGLKPPRYDQANGILQGPVVIVDDCVHVISGTFFDNEIDLEVEGTDLNLTRSHSSASGHVWRTQSSGLATDQLGLFYGWSWNHQSTISFMPHYGHLRVGDFYGGNVTHYIKKGPVGYLHDAHFKGWTNISRNNLGAKFDQHNQKIENFEKGGWKITLEDGSVRYFGSNVKGIRGGEKLCRWLQNEDKRVFASGLIFSYENASIFDWRKVSALARDSKTVMGFIKRETEEVAPNSKIVTFSNNLGQKVEYFLDTTDWYYVKSQHHFQVPKKVIRSQKPSLEYEYAQFLVQKVFINSFGREDIDTDFLPAVVSVKRYPDNRYMKIEYLDGYPKVWEERGRIERNNYWNPNSGKVIQIRGPILKGNQEGNKYTFTYNDSHTIVKDALNHEKKYYFDGEKRLTRIIQNVNGKEQNRWFQWSSGKDAGRLIKQWVSSKDKEAVYAKEYLYDERGNVIEEIFHGNFTGTAGQLKVEDDGRISSSTERISTKFEYSKDSYNLLLKEIQRDGKQIHYSYAPNSNRLVSKLVTLSGKVVERHFYDYDLYNQIVLEIEDDGSSYLQDDLAQVNKRLITRRKSISEGACIGLICEEIKSYYDKELGEEKLLETVYYDYDDLRRVKRKAAYVSGRQQPIVYEWSHDSHGNVVIEKLPSGAVIKRTYDLNDNLISEIGPDERKQTIYSYDWENRLTQKTITCGHESHTTSYSYDACSRLESVTDPYGGIKRYSYDEMGRPISQKFPIQLDKSNLPLHVPYEEKYEYDAFGRLTKRTDAHGFVEVYAFNTLGAPILEHTIGTCPVYTTYTLEGLKKAQKLGSGAEEIYEYDSENRLIKHIGLELSSSEDRLVKTLSYEGSLLKRVEDNQGRFEVMNYDGAGRVIRKEIGDSSGILSLQEYEYDGRSKVVAIRRFLNEREWITTCFEYNYNDEVISSKTFTPSGKIIDFHIKEYDIAGRIIRESKQGEDSFDAKHYEYDGFDRKVSQTDPLGNSYLWEYQTCIPSSFGLIDAITTYRPDGSWVYELHDARSLVLEKSLFAIDGTLAQHAKYGYDAYGLCTLRVEQTLQNGQSVGEEVTTKVQFGPAGRVCKRIDAFATSDERTTHWIYDTDGKLVEKVLPSGITLSHDYNKFGLLAATTSSDGSIDQKYEYDSYGRIIRAYSLDNRCTCRVYDGIGRVKQETLENNLVIKREYDWLGQIISEELPIYTSITCSYKDALLKETTLHTCGQRYTHTFDSYDNQGRVICESLPRDLGQIRHKYDALGRHIEMTTPFSTSSVPVDGFNAMGRVEKVLQGFEKPFLRTFQYDTLGQLIYESNESGKHSYGVDSRQMRRSKNSDTYSNNLLGELESIKGENNTHFGFDLDGRLLSMSKPQTDHEEILSSHVFDIEYDALDRMVRLSFAGGDVYTYSYDCFNRRMSKTLQREDKSYCTVYAYDDQFEIGSLEIGQTQYSYWKDIRLIGRRTASEAGHTLLSFIDGKPYSALLDLQGSIIGWVDLRTRSVVAKNTYDSFGVLIETESSDESARIESLGTWGYSSKRKDIESGFINFGRRYYLPEYARWLVKDPNGEVDGSNLYAYLSQNPVLGRDLWGLSKDDPFFERLMENYRNPQPEYIPPPSVYTLCDTHTIHDAMAYSQNGVPPTLKGGFMAEVIIDPQAPYEGILNGIGNSAKEVMDRAVRAAKESGKNILTGYCPTAGLFKDGIRVFSREFFGHKMQSNEIEMAANLMKEGLKRNHAVGLDTLRVHPNSNGYFIGLEALGKLGEKDQENVLIQALGGVANDKKYKRMGYRCENYMAISDFPARFANILNSSSNMITIRSGDDFLRTHFIDRPTYWNQMIKNMRAAYEK